MEILFVEEGARVEIIEVEKDNQKNSQSVYSRKGRNKILKTIALSQERKTKKNTKNENANGKKQKKGKKSQKGGDNSVFTGDMSQRTFGCRQPTWDAKCII